MLAFFTIINSVVEFWVAALLDLIGICLYLANLYLFKKLKNIYYSGTIYVFICSYVIVSQSIILEPDTYHNMFFFTPIAVFCFALFDKFLYTVISFGITCFGAISSYFIPKYLDTTLWYLSQTEKDFYVAASMLSSLAATYGIGRVLFNQKILSMAQLRKANQKLEKINSKNKGLLQLIIHDVSNPLVAMDFAIKASSQQNKHDESIARINSVCDPAILTIREIIESAREMMALEDGKIATKLFPTDVEEVFEEAVELLREPLKRKEIKVKTSCVLSPETKALIDRKSFKSSVLMNLITNAIKFSYRKSEIKIEATEYDNSIIIKVIDTGVGIPEDIQDKIFSPTHRTTRPGTEGEPGTGYGMPLAKAFMDSYGGKIQCVSEEGIGTLIKLTLQKAIEHA